MKDWELIVRRLNETGDRACLGPLSDALEDDDRLDAARGLRRVQELALWPCDARADYRWVEAQLARGYGPAGTPALSRAALEKTAPRIWEWRRHQPGIVPGDAVAREFELPAWLFDKFQPWRYVASGATFRSFQSLGDALLELAEYLGCPAVRDREPLYEVGLVYRSTAAITGVSDAGTEVEVPAGRLWRVTAVHELGDPDDRRYTVVLVNKRGLPHRRGISYDGAWDGLLVA